MATDDNAEIQHALFAINSKLGMIDGKINLIARAEREPILAVLEKAVFASPMIGQVYLLVDGKRNQQDVLEELRRFGIETSQSTVSRRMKELVTEYGVAEWISSGVMRKTREAETILNLTRWMTEWVGRSNAIVPVNYKKKPRKSK